MSKRADAVPIIHLRDEFNGSGGLNGRVPDLGPAWAMNAGSDATVTSGFARGNPLTGSFSAGRPRCPHYSVEMQSQLVGDGTVHLEMRSPTSGEGYRIFHATSGGAESYNVNRNPPFVSFTNSVAISPAGQIHTFRLEVVGTRIRFYFDGGLVHETTDATFSDAGEARLRFAAGSDARVYRFEVIDFVNPIRAAG